MPWYNASWQRRVQLTVQNTDIDSDLTDFPIYFDLSRLGTSFWNNVNSDGGDIRVTTSDETTEVPVEVSIDTGGQTGFIYFKGSPSSSTTTVFYMYFQNSGASLPAEDATYGRENVWKAAYRGVWHLEQDPSGSAPQMIDSTSNDNDGTSAGTMTTGDLIAAKVHKGIEFDGSNDYINVANAASLQFATDFSISCWFKESGSSAGYTTLVSKRDNDLAVDANYLLGFNPDGGVNIFQAGFYDGGFLVESVSWSANFSAGTWYHIVATFEDTGADTRITIYKNGAQLSQGTKLSSQLTANTAPVRIGATEYSAPDEFFNGVIDEVRIAAEAHSAAWIKAQHSAENNNAAFIASGAVETNGSTSGRISLGIKLGL